jgi:small subunit ribosomal protein S20
MPILHASYKSIKKTVKRTLRNKTVKSELKTETKKFLDLLTSKKLPEAKTQLTNLITLLDKAKSKGILHENTAARKKSRLSKRLSNAQKSETK